MKILFAFFVFATLQVAHAETKIPAQIDVTKLTREKADAAVYTCGLELLRTLRYIRICAKQGAGCRGYADSKINDLETSLDALTLEVRKSFGMTDEYADYHQYDGTAYSFNMVASSGVKSASPLHFNFKEYFQDDKQGQRETVTAKLETEGEMPLLSFVEKEIKHCAYDKWGNIKCKASTYEFSDAFWIVEDNFKPIVNWKNSDTNYVLEQQADFGAFMKCVEKTL